MPDRANAWIDAETVELEGLSVTLTEPVLVGRRKGYFWFPNLWNMPNGELLSTISPVPDIHLSGVPYLVLWSRDGGLTWTEPQVSCDGGQTLLHLHSGDSILLPYDLRPRPQGIGAPHNVIPAGQREFDYVPTGVVITGMPSPVPLTVPGLDVVSFSFNGQTLWLQDGTYLATAYGHFEGDQRDSIVAVESTDGVNWTFRSVIAGADCPVPGNGGPSESAICRTPDGRIMCVFRVESRMPLGQTFSSDEGRTWAPAVPMPGVFSVQPSLAMMADGAIALAAGRPGLYLWLNTDGGGQNWQQLDILAHHNSCLPDEQIIYSEDLSRQRTTSYTEVVAVDENTLLYMYDRVPNGWRRIPEDMDDTNSVWLIRATLKA
ncbi:MAG: sialidase family protein [Caldilineaceae bacterium]|nr:sialidase family protein [Caldilineaceae bacterium]